MDEQVCNWYEHYLHNRRASATLKGCCSVVDLCCGTPQGGVLSPVIWNINFDGVLQLFDGTAVSANGFADDVSLLITGVDLPVMADIMQGAIDMATTWGSSCGLTFGSAKTVAVIFSHKRTVKASLPELFINGDRIQYSDSAKYLGVTLDCRLNFKEHVREKCKKATRLLMAAREALGKLWGPSLRTTKWMYEAIVRPQISYGALVWAHKVPLNSAPLVRVQRLAMLMICLLYTSDAADE